jgi:hypothetical protein
MSNSEETEKQIELLKQARARRTNALGGMTREDPSYQMYKAKQESQPTAPAPDMIVMSREQFEATLQETVARTLQKMNRDADIQKQIVEQSQQVRKTGDPEVDEYINDLQQESLQDRYDLMRKTVVEKLRKSGITNWNKDPGYTPVKIGEQVHAGEGESQQAFLARTKDLTKGVKESMVGLGPGGTASESKAKKDAERQQ